jgi:hypothetical protein
MRNIYLSLKFYLEGWLNFFGESSKEVSRSLRFLFSILRIVYTPLQLYFQFFYLLKFPRSEIGTHSVLRVKSLLTVKGL